MKTVMLRQQGQVKKSKDLKLVGQVADEAMRLAMAWTAQVRSRVSEAWRFFFTPWCPDWYWGTLNLLQNEYREISLGVKTAEQRTSHTTSSQCRGCQYVNPCIHIPRGPPWPVMAIPLPFTGTKQYL